MYSYDFFSQKADCIAPLILGAEFIRIFPDGRKVQTRIVETEAYGVGDPACHAYRRKTDRNKSMFLRGGHIYVYKIYGIHTCINLVTGMEGEAEAVLIRALEVNPPEWSTGEKPHRLASGPGKLCKFLEIDKTFDGLSIFGNGLLEILPPKKKIADEERIQTTRIGITQGIEIPWRWYISGNRSVSKK